MKRALLIGINYVGTKNELRGCINDINNVAAYLQTTRLYPSGSCIMLSDVTSRKPTRANILAAFQELLQGARAGDELWFHYSGHGSLQRDFNGDEESGTDSCICPLDYIQAGLITDDAIRFELAQRVPEGVRLYVVLDMCHSGTGCDLRYKFDDTSYLIQPEPLPTSYAPGAWILRQTSYEFKRHAKTVGDVFCISGCQDTEFSADAYLNSKATGVLTHSLLQSLNANPSAGYKWKHLLKDVCCRERIGRFNQRTSLTSGKFLSLEDPVFATPTLVLTQSPTPAPTSSVPSPTPAPTSAPTPILTPPMPAKPPAFAIPLWIQVYLRQLQRMGRSVPQWVYSYIQTLNSNSKKQLSSKNMTFYH